MGGFDAGAVRGPEQIREPAAASLREGVEETMTVVNLGLPDQLRRTLSSTDPIIDGVRCSTHRAKRWETDKGRMVARWAPSAQSAFAPGRARRWGLTPSCLERAAFARFRHARLAAADQSCGRAASAPVRAAGGANRPYPGGVRPLPPS